jgi:hypothetical protein
VVSVIPSLVIRLLFRISDFEFRNFLLQFLFQIPPRRFLYRAPLRRDRLLLGLALLARPRFEITRQMRNLRPVRADLPLIRLGVGIHRGFNDPRVA